MPVYNFMISDGKNVNVSVDTEHNQDALNIALNALTQFANSSFPPPERLSIDVSDPESKHLATMSFIFQITYAAGVLS